MASATQKSTPILIGLLAVIVGYMGYTGSVVSSLGFPGISAQKAQAVAMNDTLTTLEAQIDSAKRELARGTAEDVRKKLEAHRASLALLRRLVPERNEVPNLLDDMSTRAKIRGVTLAQVVPLPVEDGPVPFNTYKYQISVVGHYDQIGEFLSDVASLQRIIVPQDVQVAAAENAAAKAMGDSTGALLEAKFQIRTFVKSGSLEGTTSGT
ncbi:MAG TPA: type 4a pilus biogenesis protein PilO [Gemmatimonadales bacterium]|jgi:Tfp pilus assembly protein PilO|nr:type 4a pilus biogenesis protein PilO [Gemmatimonadales bacterium]